MTARVLQRDAGMVTAELAMALPVLVLLMLAAVAVVRLQGTRVDALDAAREAARSAARGDDAAAAQAVSRIVPGATLSLTRDGTDVVAAVRARGRPLGMGWLAVSLEEQAVAALEPSGPTDFGTATTAPAVALDDRARAGPGHA